MPIKNVFNEIISYENIIKAEHDIAAGKHFTDEVMKFRANYEDNIYDLVQGLRRGVVPKTHYKHFYVYEPKMRKVIYIDYKSKLIQRAIYNVINPLISKGFIEHSYSCIVGRGQLSAMKQLQSWLKYAIKNGNKWYYCKLDTEKFFYRIDHDVMMKIIEKKIYDKKAVKLIKHYITDAPIPFGLPLGIRSPKISEKDMLWDVGIPIGGGLSHMLANMYMDPLDQECKRRLRIKYYTRYMDDVIFLSDSKQQLHEWKDYIEDFLNTNLKLTLNNRTAMRPISQGIEYVGYRIWPDYVTLRKSTTLRMKRNLKKKAVAYSRYKCEIDEISQTVASYSAMLKHCDCKELNSKIWGNFILSRNTEMEDLCDRLSLFWNC